MTLVLHWDSSRLFKLFLWPDICAPFTKSKSQIGGILNPHVNRAPEIESFWEDSPCNPRNHHIVARVIEVQGCFTPFSFNLKGSTGFMLHFFSWGCLKQDQKNRPQESKGRVCSTSSLTIGSLGDILVVAGEITTCLPKLVKLSWNKTVVNFF